MTLNKLAFSLVGSLALASTGFAGTAPSGKACTACTAPAPAESDLGFSLGVGYDSKYIFRGLDLADNWVSANLAYSLPLTSTVKLNLDANYGTSADDGFANGIAGGSTGLSYQRLELGAGLSADLGGVELGVGYRWYHHMGDGNIVLDDSNEVGVTLATKVGPINLGIAANYDFDGQGWYFEAGANTEFKLCDKVSLVPGVSIGYASSYTYQIVGKPSIDGFTAVNLSLALPIKLTKHATLTPFIAYNISIDALHDAGGDDQFHGGASINVKF
jgi:hypothetical protein